MRRSLLAVGILVCVVSPAWAASPAWDVTATGGTGVGTVVTLTPTLAATANRVLVVAVQGQVGHTVTSATGLVGTVPTAFTKLVELSDGVDQWGWLGYLVNPDSGVQSIVVTVSPGGFAVWAIDYTGADQGANPFRNTAGNSAQGVSGTPLVTATGSAASDLVIAAVSADSSLPTGPSEGTQRVSRVQSSFEGSGGGDIVSGGATQAATFSTASARWIALAGSLKPVTGAAAPVRHRAIQSRLSPSAWGAWLLSVHPSQRAGLAR